MDLSAKDADLNSLAESNISLANELADKLKPFLHIDGVRKIERQISQEIRFLQKVFDFEILFRIISWPAYN